MTSPNNEWAIAPQIAWQERGTVPNAFKQANQPRPLPNTQALFCNSLGLFATPQPQQREPGTKVVLPNTAGAALALDPSDAGNTLACILHARLAQRLCGVRGIQRIIILEDSAPFLVVVANRLERHRLEVVGLLVVAVEPQPADNVHVLLLPLNKTKKKTQS